MLRSALACLVLLGVVTYALVVKLTEDERAHCTVRAGDGRDEADRTLGPDQAANAATIAAVAARRGLPERAVTIALATAMQESQLRNIGHGDRDSLGLFQQRPTQGWGTADQIRDPVYSAGRFYDHLVEIPGYSRLPLTVAAQRVQRSGYPQAYAKHEADAAALTAALTGRRAAALSCTPEPVGARHSGDPERVRAQLVREFGSRMLGGEPDAAPSEAARETASGRGASRTAVTVPAPGERRGWELAHWAVAHAGELDIDRVRYGSREWRADRGREGWRAVGGTAAAGAQGTGAGGGGGRVVLRVGTGH
ncbi:heavy metal transporter [Streptomyces cacaoi]|uniref:heavy metal transporter n=1 Tax=Streptomyces cacaoi TaxID=1898 RepID=UPI003322E07C